MVMEIRLREKPTGSIIVHGFPGMGLIGTISTEYLIKHLEAKSIGYIWSHDISPIAAVHEARVIQPLEIFYVKKKNIVIVHAMIDVRGLEWEISDTLAQLYKMLKAREIISLEGILGSEQATADVRAFYYSNTPSQVKRLSKLKAAALREGVIMGVTAALLLKDKSMATTGMFVEVHSKLPDSRAAAKIIELMDGYLDLDVDYKPLEKAAAEFEQKLKGYVEKLQVATERAKERQPSNKVDYLG